MELFKLFGTIAVNNQEANQSIDDTSEKVESFGSRLASGIGTVAQWSGAIVTGAAAAVGGMVAFASSSSDALDNIDKMSQKIGISRQAYQELDFICSQTGSSVDGLQAGMRSLTAAMDGVAEGTQSNIDQFAELGVEVLNADGSFRSQEEVLFDTLEALQGVEDQTERARLATELFGRSGTELMPLINGEAGSIEEMRNQAHELGLVLDDELIDSGVDLHDSLDQTKRAFQALGVQLGGVLMPIVEQASDYIQTMLPTIQDMFERIAPILTQVFESLLPPLMDLVEQIFPVLVGMIETLLPPLTDIVSTILPVIVEVISAILPFLVQIAADVLPILLEAIVELLPVLEPLLELLSPLLDLTLAILEPLLQLITELIPPLTEVITVLVAEMTDFLLPIINSLVEFINENLSPVLLALKMMFQDVWDAIKAKVNSVVSSVRGYFDNLRAGFQVISNTVNTIKTTISTVFNNIKTTIGSVIGNIRTNISNVFNGIKSTVTTVWNGIKTAITSPIETARDTLSNIVDTIVGFFANMNISFPNIPLPHFSVSPAGWQIADLLEGSIPSLGIEWYAKGGIIDGITPFGINGNNVMFGGEAGKEAIIPLENDTRGVEMIASKISENMWDGSDAVQRKLNDLIKVVEEIKNMNFVLSTGQLVGALANPMNEALGEIQIAADRGGRNTWL